MSLFVSMGADGLGVRKVGKRPPNIVCKSTSIFGPAVLGVFAVFEADAAPAALYPAGISPFLTAPCLIAAAN